MLINTRELGRGVIWASLSLCPISLLVTGLNITFLFKLQIIKEIKMFFISLPSVNGKDKYSIVKGGDERIFMVIAPAFIAVGSEGEIT